MQIVTVIVLAVVASAVLILVVLRKRSTIAVQSYGDVRKQFFKQADRSNKHRNQPPQRPAGLDTRLAMGKAVELRGLYPPTAENSAAFYKCYNEVLSSIAKELGAIDANNQWFELLSPSRRAVVLVEALEAEVNNGGFDQYYLNSSGDGAALTPGALRLFGQEQVAVMVERGNAQFPNGPSAHRNTRLLQMKDLDEEARNTWSSLDNDFYTLSLPEGGLSVGCAIPYILTHESEFFLPQ